MKNKKVKTAFSLLEMSILITVAVVIVAGSITIKTVNVATNKEAETRKKIAIIYKAIGDYLVKYKSLPCPAPIDVVKGNSTYGVSSSNGNGTSQCPTSPAPGIVLSGTNLIRGMVPVKTLGLKDEFAEDAYGSKIVYFVDKRFTKVIGVTSGVISTDGFSGTSGTGTIMTVRRTNSSTAYSYSNIATTALIVLVSYGKNKNGAFPADSTISNSAASLTDEITNNSAASFTSTFNVSSKDSGFDDIVFYKTKFQMVRDFKAENLVACTSSAGTGYTPIRGYVGQTSYKSCGGSNPPSIKKCTINSSGAGVWLAISTPC